MYWTAAFYYCPAVVWYIFFVMVRVHVDVFAHWKYM